MSIGARLSGFRLVARLGRFRQAGVDVISPTAGKEQRMAPNDNSNRSDQTSVETTAALPPDDLGGLHQPTPPSDEGAVSGLEDLPSGSALLIVRRGPNAGARFLLDRPQSRHPRLRSHIGPRRAARRRHLDQNNASAAPPKPFPTATAGCPASRAAHTPIPAWPGPMSSPPRNSCRNTAPNGSRRSS